MNGMNEMNDMKDMKDMKVAKEPPPTNITPKENLTPLNTLTKTSRPLHDFKEMRKFNINTTQFKKFKHNHIITAKYNALTFLPLAIMHQFNNYFNVFFLITAVISSISLFSPLSPMTALAPFIFVLVISLIREAFEDVKKTKFDKLYNNSPTLLWDKTKNCFEIVKWENIKVGEIIKVEKNEIIPCDVLVIKSSSENGFCYLETTNLDGESALKPRESMIVTNMIITAESGVSNLHGVIEVDPPNNDIYTLEGTLFLQNYERCYFDINNVLLRGGRLKNTDYVYGIVLYTGKDTKIMKNIKNGSLKLSTIDTKLNVIVIYILIIVICLLVISTVFGAFFRGSNMPNYITGVLNSNYLFYYNHDTSPSSSNDILEITKIIAAFFIIYNTLIPISLMITYQVVKGIQILMIEQDYKLALGPDEKIKVLSMALHEDLGMVRYIFTDKTGTLTCNEMEFKACSLFKKVFDDENEKQERDNNNSNNNLVPSSGSKRESVSNKNIKSSLAKSFDKDVILEALTEDIPFDISDMSGCPFQSYKEPVLEFALNIALNHNVLSELDEVTKTKSYQGSNPDEVTLVSAASELGIQFIDRSNKLIKVNILGQVHEFKILYKFDFSSARLRSSIIVRTSENKVKIYMKGADTVIFQKIDTFSQINILPKTKEHIDSFAKRGLRTLCYSYKIISEDEFSAWETTYKEIKYLAINDKSLIDQVELCINSLESGLTLLGVTALEDKLQENVRTDLQELIEAGINVWMITGDKLDTAESIGHSCKLFNDDTEVFKIKSDNKEQTVKRMKEILDKMKIMEEEVGEMKKRGIKDFYKSCKQFKRKKSDKEILKLSDNEALKNDTRKKSDTKPKSKSEIHRKGKNDTKTNLLTIAENKAADKLEKINLKNNKHEVKEFDNMNHFINENVDHISSTPEKNFPANHSIAIQVNNKIKDDYNFDNEKIGTISGERYMDDDQACIKEQSSSNRNIMDLVNFNKINLYKKNTIYKLNTNIENVLEIENNNLKSEEDSPKIKIKIEKSNQKNFFKRQTTITEESPVKKFKHRRESKTTDKLKIQWRHHSFIKNVNKNNKITIGSTIDHNKKDEEINDVSILNLLMDKNYFENSSDKFNNLTMWNKLINQKGGVNYSNIHATLDNRSLTNNLKEQNNTEFKFNSRDLNKLYIEENDSNRGNESNRGIDEDLGNTKLKVPENSLISSHLPNKIENKIHNIFTFKSYSEPKIMNNIRGKNGNDNHDILTIRDIEDDVKNKSIELIHDEKKRKNIFTPLQQNEINIIRIRSTLNLPTVNMKNILEPKQNETKIKTQFPKSKSTIVIPALNNGINKKEKSHDIKPKSIPNIFDYYEDKIKQLEKRKKSIIPVFDFKPRKRREDTEQETHEDELFSKNYYLINFGLIVEGASITHCLNPEANSLFWRIMKKCRSVVACRCSPLQKAEIVNFVKNKSGEITLAIGDGGNDVNMIKAANVGVGLFGKEGYQAAYNSDYAFSQFKYLKRLIFYHGRYSLSRNSYFIYFFFFKNVIFTLPQFWICFFSGFSGVNNYDQWYYLGFNSFMTTFPVGAKAMMDEDIDMEFRGYSDREILKLLIPDIFKEYRGLIPFNVTKFFLIFFISFIFSIIVFYVPFFSFKYGYQDSMGRPFSFWDNSLSTFLSVVTVHFVVVIQDTNLFTWFNTGVYLIQIFIVVFFIVVHNALDDGELSGITTDITSNLLFWCTTIITICICLVPFFIYRRTDYHFSENIINNLRQKKYEQDYAKKIYVKKLEQMTKATRTIMKFKRLYKQDNIDADNYADKRMKEMVDVYKKNKIEKIEKITRMRSKSVTNLNEKASMIIDKFNEEDYKEAYMRKNEKRKNSNKVDSNSVDSRYVNDFSEVSEKKKFNDIDKLNYNASKFSEWD